MLRKQKEEYSVEDFYFLKIKPMWRYFWSEHPAFWFICGYLFIEYWRPQSIYPALDFLPWARLFILGALLFSFADKKSKLVWTSTHTWILLFTIQIHISFLFAYNINWSIDHHINFFQWVVIFFIITRIVTTKERFYIFFLVFFLSSLKIALGTSRSFAMRGFGFTSWGLKGPPGFFENSGELAILMVMLFALSLYLIKTFWSKSGRLEKLVLLFAVLCPALTVIGSSSRGSQLALAVVLLWYYNYRLLNPKVLVVAASLALSFAFILPDEQKARFETMGDDRTSEQRILYWKNGVEMVKLHPLTGVGYYNFIPYFSDFYPDDILFRNRQGQLRAELPHNILVQVATDAGLPALTLYLLIILSLLRLPIYPKNQLLQSVSKGLKLGIIGFFIAGQFVTVAYYPYLWISTALLISLAQSQEFKKHKAISISPVSSLSNSNAKEV